MAWFRLDVDNIILIVIKSITIFLQIYEKYWCVNVRLELLTAGMMGVIILNEHNDIDYNICEGEGIDAKKKIHND